MAKQKKTLYMETTSIEASQSAAEICSELVKSGATQIATDYKDGKITGLRWMMRHAGQDVMFSMPARVDPVFRLLNRRRLHPGQHTAQDREQAERVAWRQLLRWVQAQLAMIDTGMVESAEVFSPYMVVEHSGKTMWQALQESRFKMLPAPETKQ